MKTLLEENIIAALGLQPLSDAKKVDVLEKIIDLIQRRVMIRAMKQLSDEEHDELTKIMDENDNEKTLSFLTEKAGNLAEIMEEETVRVKEELLKEKEQWLEEDLERGPTSQH